MICNAYSIFDTKALIFHRPFFETTHGAATRLLVDLVNDQNTSIGRHPSDYVLYCVGTYNDSLGVLTPIDPRQHIIDLVALVKLNSQHELFNAGAK